MTRYNLRTRESCNKEIVRAMIEDNSEDSDLERAMADTVILNENRDSSFLEEDEIQTEDVSGEGEEEYEGIGNIFNENANSGVAGSNNSDEINLGDKSESSRIFNGEMVEKEVVSSEVGPTLGDLMKLLIENAKKSDENNIILTKKFDEHDNKLNQINNNFKILEEKLDRKLELAVEKINKNVEEIKINMEKCRADCFNKVNTEMTELTQEISNKYDTNFDIMENKILENEAGIISNTEKITEVKKDQTKIWSKINENSKIIKTQNNVVLACNSELKLMKLGNEGLYKEVRDNSNIIQIVQEKTNDLEKQLGEKSDNVIVRNIQDPIKLNINLKNPMEFIKNLKCAIKNHKLNKWESIVDILNNTLDKYLETKSWWTFIKDNVENLDDFIREFKGKYWSNAIQSELRTNIFFGKYRADGRLKLSEYFMDKIIIFKNIEPKLAEGEMVKLLSDHYDAEINRARIVRNVITVTEFVNLLGEYEMNQNKQNSRGFNRFENRRNGHEREQGENRRVKFEFQNRELFDRNKNWKENEYKDRGGHVGKSNFNNNYNGKTWEDKRGKSSQDRFQNFRNYNGENWQKNSRAWENQRTEGGNRENSSHGSKERRYEQNRENKINAIEIEAEIHDRENC